MIVFSCLTPIYPKLLEVFCYMHNVTLFTWVSCVPVFDVQCIFFFVGKVGKKMLTIYSQYLLRKFDTYNVKVLRIKEYNTHALQYFIIIKPADEVWNGFRFLMWNWTNIIIVFRQYYDKTKILTWIWDICKIRKHCHFTYGF